MIDFIHPFMLNFLICNVILTIIVLLLFLEKKLLGRFITASAQYHIWIIFLFFLPIPLLPVLLFMTDSLLGTCFQSMAPVTIFHNAYEYLLSFFSPATKNALQESGSNSLNTTVSIHTGNTDWMNDLYTSVNRHVSDIIPKILFIIWILGIIYMLVISIVTRLRLWKIKRSAALVTDYQINLLINHICKEINIKKSIPVYQSSDFPSPVLIGYIRPAIFLPPQALHLSNEELRFMLLHEVQHQKHKDNLINQLMSILLIFYWFHPLIWFSFKEIRIQRELNCDNAVLHTLSISDSKAYGITLLHYIEKMSDASYRYASGLGGNAAQIRKRIENIVSFYPDTPVRKRRSRLVLLLTLLFLLSSIPFFHVYAMQTDEYSFSYHDKNIVTPDLNNILTDQKGSFVLYDSNDDQWQIYHPNEAVKRVSPDSTYKIYDAVMALESGIITPSNSTISWDQTDYPLHAWNQDQDVTTALQYSVNWYFQNLDHCAGKETVKRFVERIGYGNNRIDNTNDYWLESTLKISPVEQVILLKKLFQNDYEFNEENIKLIKNALTISDIDGCRLYGKTGTGNINGQNINGWFVGAVEKNNHCYYFALNIHDSKNANGTDAAKLTQLILKNLNILE